MGLGFGCFADQQVLFLRQRKTGTLLRLPVEFNQFGRVAGGGKEAAII
jgi:hypothetical protein